MLHDTTLDYVQHEERGYCANNPAVIAGTKAQVVDRAVKQLLEALQANGFDLDGDILKRGDGWLRYDAETSAWQYSNDAGVTWLPMTQGTVDHTLLQNIGTHTHAQIDTHLDTLPAALASPVTIGNVQIYDDGTHLYVSHDAGATLHVVLDDGAAAYNFAAKHVSPPQYVQESEPTLINSTYAIWRIPSTGDVYLLYQGTDSTLRKIAIAGGIIGEIRMISHNTLPAGWLMCDGSPILRSSALGQLYETLNFPYGIGDGSTTCNLPDLRDVFPLGAGLSYTLGQEGGEEVVTLENEELPEHSHTVSLPYASAPGTENTVVRGGTQEGSLSIESYTLGDGKSHNNMPPYACVNYMVYAGA